MKMSWKKFTVATLLLSLVSFLVIGATVDLKKGSTGVASSGLKSPVIQKVTVDASVNGFTTGDTVELFNVPKNHLITRCWMQMLTAATAAYTVDIGIKGDTLDKFNADVPLNGSAGTVKYGDGTTGATTVMIPYATGTSAKVVQISDIKGGAVSTFKAVIGIEMVDLSNEAAGTGE